MTGWVALIAPKKMHKSAKVNNPLNSSQALSTQAFLGNPICAVLIPRGQK